MAFMPQVSKIVLHVIVFAQIRKFGTHMCVLLIICKEIFTTKSTMWNAIFLTNRKKIKLNAESYFLYCFHAKRKNRYKDRN